MSARQFGKTEAWLNRSPIGKTNHFCPASSPAGRLKPQDVIATVDRVDAPART